MLPSVKNIIEALEKGLSTLSVCLTIICFQERFKKQDLFVLKKGSCIGDVTQVLKN